MSGSGNSASAGSPAAVANEQQEIPALDVRVEGGTILALGAGAGFVGTGFVDIVGDRVAAVGPLEDRPAASPRRVIDATGSIVMPGLVDAHTHLFQVAARGLGDGLGLAEWLRTHMIPLALALRHDEMVALSELGALHSLRSGTVAAINHHYGGQREPEDVVAVAHAMERVGMAGAVARMMIGERTDAADVFKLPAAYFGYTNAQEVELTEAAMREKQGGLVALWPGPANVAYCSDEILVAGAELARRYGVRWHTHAAEDAFAVDVTLRCQAGRRTLILLDDLGVGDQAAVLAHACGSTTPRSNSPHTAAHTSCTTRSPTRTWVRASCDSRNSGPGTSRWLRVPTGARSRARTCSRWLDSEPCSSAWRRPTPLRSASVT